MSAHQNYINQTLDHYLPSDTLVFALGGLGEVGKNTYCVQCEDEIVIIDAGVSFPDEELLGVDYVIPDYTYLIRNQEKIKGLFVTHGHEDHIGGITFLLKVCPIADIYAANLTCALIRHHLEEQHMTDRVKLHVIDHDSRFNSKHFHIGFFNITHSIPDCLGMIIQTPNGWIMATGDFKFDLTPITEKANADYQRMSFMGDFGIDLLLSDSTNSAVPGFSISEKEVAKSLLEEMQKTQGRLLIATFSSNVYRVQQIITAAVECGRRVCVIGRSIDTMITIARQLGYINAKDSDFLSPEALDSVPANKVCVLCTGTQGEPLAALSRMASGSNRFIKIIPGDTVIFSSSAIPGNVVGINRIVNSLTRLGAVVKTRTTLNSLHTTGHASKEEQELMLQLVHPRFFMPVHGEYKMLREHAATAVETGIPPENIFICANGDVVIMRDHKCYAYTSRFQTDDIYVDGTDSSGVATAVLRDRKILADNGLVAVIITIDSRFNKIMVRPNIVSRGFVFIKESQTLLKEAELLVYEALKKKMQQKVTFGELKNTVRETLEPFLYTKTHRNPIVIPVILNSKEAMAAMAAKKESSKASSVPVKEIPTPAPKPDKAAHRSRTKKMSGTEGQPSGSRHRSH